MVRFGLILCTGVVLACATLHPSGWAQDAGLGVTSVEVFANSAMLIQGSHARAFRLTVHRMDQLEQVKQALNRQLPRGGEAEARQWLVANAARVKQQIQPAAMAAANAVSMANRYRLDRLPAIVINGRVVVYGTTDVDAALAHFQATRRRP